jgi:phage terminase large subunit-like protein
LFGATEPRLWTPPLRPLNKDTSVGFNQAAYARDTLHHPFLPWQEWLSIHTGELLPDGRPRFRIVIVLVSRQNGKTEVPVILCTYWMFVDQSPLILGTSTKIEYARETWDKTRKLILRTPALADEYDPARWFVRGAGDTSMWTRGEESRYKIAAANEEGGRSLSVHRGIADEWRQHRDYSAWNAMEPAASYEDSQIWALSNAGSDKSVVLNDYRDQALNFINTGVGNYRIGLFEWSAPEDADPEDPAALLQANPRVGYGANLEDLQLEAAEAVRKGGEALTGFQTEKMCIRVKVLNPAIDPGQWLRRRHPGPITDRSRLAACIDVSPDGAHVTLAVAAVLEDQRVRVEVAGSWTSIARARAELPGLVRRINPRKLGWFPSGPAAALAADLTPPDVPTRETWNAMAQPVRGDMAAACMGLEELVRSGVLLHSGDPLLDAHVAEAERKKRGDTWVFVRHGDGHVDAVYATAGAVHLARTLPPPIGRPRLVIATEQ